MKKYLVSIASLAAMVGLVACQKTELKPSPITEGSTFSLAADIEQTKTTLNNLEVNWEEGDVLYLVTTDGTWGKPYSEDKSASSIAEYTYSAGTFASEATIANGTYTFNALYGSASQKSYHRGASTTYNLQSTQSQDCMNPTAHLKDNDALVGSFTASVPRTTPASVSMSHIFAIMRVDVKNATGADVELKSFEMSAAGATLAGIFTVNFANSPIDITEKSSQSSSIKVDLTNGTVASGESLPVYFVMAPLAGYSGNVTFTVTDVNDVEYTKTVALSNITFSAGSLNTTPYKITTGAAPETSIYSTEFNYAIDGSSYASSSEIIGVDSDGETSWGIIFGNWNGSNCAQLRVYSAGNFGSVYNKFDVSYATKVSYKAKVSDTNLKLNTYYSTDRGQNWVKVDENKALTTVLTEYSFTISETGEFARNRIKFEVTGTKPSSGNYQLTIDDVAIYGNGEVLETVITKLDAPKNLMADLSTSSVNSIDVVWDAVDNAGSYMVTAKPAGGTEVSKEVTTNSYTFTGLEYDTDYTISVYAKSSDTSLFTDSDVVTFAETVTTGPKPSTGGETKYFVKVTSAPADWSGEYLIVYEDGNVAFDGSLTKLDAASNTVAVTISDSKIEATDALLNSTFTINAGGTTIQSKSGYYIGQTSDANGLQSSTSTSYDHTLSFTDGAFTAVSGGAYLRYNSASNQLRFRYYKSSSYTGQKAIQLYKLKN